MKPEDPRDFPAVPRKTIHGLPATHLPAPDTRDEKYVIEDPLATQRQCTFKVGVTGPQCCIVSDDGTHSGHHLFKCEGKHCPGLAWPASIVPHPTSCVGEE